MLALLFSFATLVDARSCGTAIRNLPYDQIVKACTNSETLVGCLYERVAREGDENCQYCIYEAFAGLWREPVSCTSLRYKLDPRNLGVCATALKAILRPCYKV